MSNVDPPVFTYEIQEKCTRNQHTDVITNQRFMVLVYQQDNIRRYIDIYGHASEIEEDYPDDGWLFVSLEQAKSCLNQFINNVRKKYVNLEYQTQSIVENGTIEI